MTYDFHCKECKKDYEILCSSFKDFEEFKLEGFQCPVCKEKGIYSRMKQIWSSRKHMKIFLKGPGFTRSEA